MTYKSMKQDKNDQNHKKETTPVVGRKPYGKSRFICLIFFIGVIGLSAVAEGLTDAEIPTMLQERIDRDKMGVGIVVGIIDEHGSRVFSYGKMKKGGGQEVSGDTLFEIGSITKVFTTLLLQDMVDRGELQLDDHIRKFLPAYVKTPSYKGQEITLVDLATHTSGLPRVPYGFWYILFHDRDPYAAFTYQKLYKFLSHYKLHEEIGTNFEYSNLGMMLLGQVLSLRAETNYESLILQRICEPLKMNSTCITLTPERKSRFAQGHDDSENPANCWSQPLPGAGGLRSSVNDMLKFLSAEMGLTRSSLSAAMLKTQVPHYTPTDPSMEATGLGWAIDRKSGIVWHNGGTSGYRSWIDFNTKTRRGVVVLANSSDDVDDVGAVLAGKCPYHKVANIDFKIYDRYTGKYKCADKTEGRLTFTVTRNKDHLFARLNGQHANEILPESETHFFNNQFNAQFIFERNENGAVTTLILHQHGAALKFIKTK